MKLSQNITHLLPLVTPALIIGTGILLLADTVGNPHKVADILIFPSYVYGWITVFLVLLARTQIETILPRPLKPLLFLGTVALSVATVWATVFDFNSPPNTLFVLTRLQQVRMLVLSLYLFHISLLSLSNAWWAQHWKKALFLYPAIMAGAVVVTRLFPFDLFFHMAKDDTLFENIQVAVLLLGSAASAAFSFHFKRHSQLKLAGFFALAAFGLFFVAGEEISWGQRLFGWEPTELIDEINYQDEYTLHNLHFFQHKVLYGYVTLCILAITLPWITRAVPALRRFRNFVPSPLLLFFFLFPLLIYRGQIEGEYKLPWAEAVEHFFYAGVALWLVQLGILFTTTKKPRILQQIKKSLFE